MRVLVVGQGAREHALAWRIAKDEDAEVLCAPGNAGTAEVAENRRVAADDVAGILRLSRDASIDLVVVGPEAPLVGGLVDALRESGIAAFGPTRAAARLEGSKAFSKEFMARHGIPTAGFRVFTKPNEAEAYVRSAQRPLVVKADGLASGKGVVVADDADEAAGAIDRMMRQRAFGDASATLVVEERLEGPEVSYHVVSDGERYVALAPAQDHKRVRDGDRGPNTGGMGAYSPPSVVSAEMEQHIRESIVEPTLEGMAKEGHPFRGALFVGLMIVRGEPQVLEYNVRFGDPECECIFARWKGDVLPLLHGAARGDLRGVEPTWGAPCSLAVVLASKGYPGAIQAGLPITGLAAAADVAGVNLFHAGTTRSGDDLVTSAGRVLTVTATGNTIDQAAARAYAACKLVEFPGKHYRKDIGFRDRSPGP